MLLKTHQYLIRIKQYFPAKLAGQTVTLAVILIYMNTYLFAAENEGRGWVVGPIVANNELAVAVANRNAAEGHRPAVSLGELAWRIGLSRVRCQ